MKKRFSIILILSVAFVLMMGSVAMAAPQGTTPISNELKANIEVEGATVENVQNTSSQNWYATIKDAVDAANEGDTLEVSAGNYEENVNINTNSITLKAAEDVTPEITGTITITASGVTVDGLILLNRLKATVSF